MDNVEVEVKVESRRVCCELKDAGRIARRVYEGGDESEKAQRKDKRNKKKSVIGNWAKRVDDIPYAKLNVRARTRPARQEGDGERTGYRGSEQFRENSWSTRAGEKGGSGS